MTEICFTMNMKIAQRPDPNEAILESEAIQARHSVRKYLDKK